MKSRSDVRAILIRKKWEVLNIWDPSQEELEKASEEGWEPFAVRTTVNGDGDRFPVYYFKREKLQTSAVGDYVPR